MKHIILPSSVQERLVYYLAAEEFLAQCNHEGFFVWQCRPTVIFGRNQDMNAEVNLEYCAANGIEVFRRRSGGGCVYADMGNLMLSYIVNDLDVNSAFESFLDRLASFLRGHGLDAVTTQHNDVLLNGRKVSGNACFAKGKTVIVHGTLLFDEDFAMMSSAITPSAEKLSTHGVKSVRQRCINLREAGLSLSMEELKSELVDFFCDGSETLSSLNDVSIRQIEESYLDPEFLSGRF